MSSDSRLSGCCSHFALPFRPVFLLTHKNFTVDEKSLPRVSLGCGRYSACGGIRIKKWQHFVKFLLPITFFHFVSALCFLLLSPFAFVVAVSALCGFWQSFCVCLDWWARILWIVESVPWEGSPIDWLIPMDAKWAAKVICSFVSLRARLYELDCTIVQIK